MKNDSMIVNTIRIKPTKPMIWLLLINVNSHLGIVSFAFKYLLSQTKSILSWGSRVQIPPRPLITVGQVANFAISFNQMRSKRIEDSINCNDLAFGFFK